MTTLVRGSNWKVVVQGREHGVPHVSLGWADGREVLAIETLALLSGRPPAALLAAALSWMSAHRDELWSEWRRLNPR